MTTRHDRLTEELRALRARTGLSLAALAERTTYSKSSWERYLNGKSLPPRQAVQELCRAADEPDGRLLALWEIAESSWSGRAALPAPSPPPPSDEQPPPGTRRPRARRGRLMVLLASAYALLAGGVAVALVLLPDRDAPGDESLPASAPYSLAAQCRADACEGRDPMRLVCGIGPDTLTTYRTTTGAHVELRHSEKCGASWARMWGTRIGDRLEVTATGPHHDVRVEDTADTKTYVYTAMTSAHRGTTVRACFRAARADGEPECVEARVGETTAPRKPEPLGR